MADYINVTVSLEKFYSYSSWNIVETFDKIFLPSPRTSSITYMGASCDNIIQLDEENNKRFNFNYLINNNMSKGVIYMAFGSQMPWNWAPIEVINNFLDTFRRLSDYTVIWSINTNITNITVPSNVYLHKWVPQTLILSHNRTKLFITHGGLKSFKESICGGVPMLSIPFYIDQTKNSLNGELLGILERLDRFRLSSNNIYDKIIKIIKNESYKLNILKTKEFTNDRIVNPTKESTFNILKIIRIKHKYPNSKEFWKVKGSKLNFLTRYFCDTFITTLIVIILLI